jgi:hypothetical protein
MVSRGGYIIFVLAGCLGLGGGWARAETPVRVQILSAVVKDKVIVGATAILQKPGAQSVTAVTNASGEALLLPPYADASDGVMLIVKQHGYSPLVVKCPCDGMTYAISPVMRSLDGLRVVLNWGLRPADLDAHLAFPGNHIFWSAKLGRDANLDVDDRDGFGPETITVSKKKFGEGYVYAVHDYDAVQKPWSESLSKSNAAVFVYMGQSLVKSYRVPRAGAGNLWVVFRVDGNGEFHDINRLERALADGGQMSAAAVTRYLASGSVSVARVAASEVSVGEAQRLNKLGEQAYHARKYEEAIDYYREAIDLDAAFGQAYSNLGLAYQRVDRVAEAIWANREAIAFASGPTANVVRASSHYNIARIYEAAGQFEDALRHFELAEQEKPSPTYRTAIGRMRARIP